GTDGEEVGGGLEHPPAHGRLGPDPEDLDAVERGDELVLAHRPRVTDDLEAGLLQGVVGIRVGVLQKQCAHGPHRLAPDPERRNRSAHRTGGETSRPRRERRSSHHPPSRRGQDLPLLVPGGILLSAAEGEGGPGGIPLSAGGDAVLPPPPPSRREQDLSLLVPGGILLSAGEGGGGPGGIPVSAGGDAVLPPPLSPRAGSLPPRAGRNPAVGGRGEGGPGGIPLSAGGDAVLPPPLSPRAGSLPSCAGRDPAVGGYGWAGWLLSRQGARRPSGSGRRWTTWRRRVGRVIAT